MQLVERIQKLCESRCTTLIGLEREIGLSRGAIRRWGENSPSIDKLQKVAEYFKVSTDFLIYGFEMHTFNELVYCIFKDMSEDEIKDKTGFTEDEYARIYMIGATEQPKSEIIEKIIKANDSVIVLNDEIWEAAGYKKRADIRRNPIPLSDYTVPSEFTNAVEARAYVDMHAIFGSDGFDADNLSDEEIVDFANELMQQMSLVKHKYKK